MADQDARALLLTIQANTELLRSNLSAAERAVEQFTTQTQSHLDASDARFELFGKSIEKLEGPLERLKALGEGAFAFLVGESLVEKGKQALEFAGNIQFMATQVGVSTDFLQKFRYAASQSGASLEVTDTSLIKFSRSVGEAANGNAGLVKQFDALGVGVLDANGKVRSVEAVFKDTADAVSKIDNPAQKTAATLGLFGRSASALIPVLSGGSAGFTALGDAAQQLGIVLGPDLIEHAEDVNHKMAALKLILDAQFASAVSQNAAAIGQLAAQFVNLAGGVAQFLSHNPREAFAIIGGLVGLRLGGIPGAAIGAIGGVALGAHIDSDNRDASLDRTIRSTDLVTAGRRYEAAQKGAGGASTSNYRFGDAPDISSARDDYIRQLALYRTAKAKGFDAHPEKPDLGSEAAGAGNPEKEKKPKKEKEDHTDEREAARRRSVLDQSARLDEQGLAYEAQLTANSAELLDIDRNKVETQKQKQLDDVAQGVIEKRITAGEAQGLVDRINDNAILAQQVLDRKQAQTAESLAGNLAEQALSASRELAQSSIGLASTRQQRLALELQLLDLEKTAERDRLNRTVNDTDKNGNLLASDSAVTEAKAGLKTIDARYGAQAATLNRSEASPLTSYRQQLDSAVGSTDALKDSLENVQVDGLKGLQDGFVGVIEGTKTLSSAFHDMAASVISDLLKIGAEKVILSVLGFSEGGSVPNVLHLAGGGNVFGAGGPRDDKVPAMLSAGEYVINAAAASRHKHLVEAINSDSLPRFADGGLVSNIRAPSLGSMVRASNTPQVIYVQVDKSNLFDAHVTRLAAPLAQAAMVGGAAQASQDFADQRMAAIP